MLIAIWVIKRFPRKIPPRQHDAVVVFLEGALESRSNYLNSVFTFY